MKPNSETRLRISLTILSMLFSTMGLLHFLQPKPFVRIMPPFLMPIGSFLVAISGIFEILGGIGILPDTTRGPSGLGLIILLIAVFPANIQMAILEWNAHHGSPTFAVLLLRLPLQFVLIRWVYLATRLKSAIEE